MEMPVYFLTLILGLWFMIGFPKTMTALSGGTALFCGLIILTTPLTMASMPGVIFMASGMVCIIGLLGFLLIKLGVYQSF